MIQRMIVLWFFRIIGMKKILVSWMNQGFFKAVCCMTLFLFSVLDAAASGPFPNSCFTTVNNLELHYRLWEPAAETTKGNVLLVHGFSGSTFSWEKVADSLSHLGYQVVAADVPPFGYSDRNPRQNQSVTARAALLNIFLKERFPGKQWHIAGHSMGGGIVQAMALMEPEQFVSVCFVAPTLFESTEQGSKGAPPLWLRIPGLTTLAGHLAESWFLTQNRIRASLSSAYGESPSDEQVQAYLEPLTVPGTARAILNSARFSKELVSLDVENFSVPALAVWGENDTWVSLDSRREIAESIAGLQLEVIEDAGHNPMETHFDTFMALWLTFLNNL